MMHPTDQISTETAAEGRSHDFVRFIHTTVKGTEGRQHSQVIVCYRSTGSPLSERRPLLATRLFFKR